MPQSKKRNAELHCMNPDEPDELLKFRYGRGSFYEHGTFTTRTLDVLSNERELLSHDERTFQLLHLQTEIAWYDIHFELRAVIGHLSGEAWEEGVRLMRRVVGLSQIPLLMLQLMMENISQYSLLSLRVLLPDNATGIDSPGMINLRYASRRLWTAYEQAIAVLGYTPASLAIARTKGAELSGATKSLLDLFDEIQQFDIQLMNWKQQHLRMVWMYLGGAPNSPENTHTGDGCPVHSDGSASAHEPTSLRGRPISELQRMTAMPLFPKLWEISGAVYAEMDAIRIRSKPL